eukprot:1290891-Amphidinium_carterae.1
MSVVLPLQPHMATVSELHPMQQTDTALFESTLDKKATTSANATIEPPLYGPSVSKEFVAQTVVSHNSWHKSCLITCILDSHLLPHAAPLLGFFGAPVWLRPHLQVLRS